MAAFVSSADFARVAGISRDQVNELCRHHPGFAFQRARRCPWRIPAAHAERLRAGEQPASIAAHPSIAPPPISPAPDDRDEVRRRWQARKSGEDGFELLYPETARWMQEGADASG